MFPVALHRIIAVLLCLAALCGCSTLPNGRIWGEDATLRPGWERVQQSAIDAARDPWVWAPAIGAAVFQIDHWDRHVSDWAREHTPIFGSQGNAENWSDDLRTASVVAHYATILATPGGADAQEWVIAKAKGTLVDAAAVAATVFVTRSLKTSVGRERPNGSDDESFPSGHTSASAVHTRLASRNLRSVDMAPGARRACDVGLYALTIGTSWARIEAGFHYPSDTLFAMALGNFIASFVNDAFMGLDPAAGAIAVIVTSEGATLQWARRF
jgi:membrane-associated phospholipid phosphatase